MEKIISIEEIGEKLEILTDYSCGDKPFDIQIISDFIDKAKKEGANNIKITGESEYDSCYVIESIEIQPVRVTVETDEDFEIRVIDYESRKAAAKNVENARKIEREKEQYEALKLKYGK